MKNTFLYAFLTFVGDLDVEEKEELLVICLK